jgi:hypothetical protein
MNQMMAEGVIHGTTSTLSRVHVAKWDDAAMAEMEEKGDIIRNAWTRNQFEWFVKDAVERAGGKDGGEDGGCHDKRGNTPLVRTSASLMTWGNKLRVATPRHMRGKFNYRRIIIQSII